MSRIAIRTPSRLHFSLIDLNGTLGRIDGSVGLAIAQPEFRIIAQKANSVLINSNQYANRARKIVEKLKKNTIFLASALMLFQRSQHTLDLDLVLKSHWASLKRSTNFTT